MAASDKNPLQLLSALVLLVWSVQCQVCAGQNTSANIANKTCASQLDLYLCRPKQLPGDSCPLGPQLENVRFRDVDPYGALFVFLDGLPIIALFTVFLFFNVNIAATPRHSFVFFYQVAPLVLYQAANRLNVYFRTGGVLWGFVNLNNAAALSLFSSSLPFFALRYSKLVLIVLLIPVSVVVRKCCSHVLEGDGRFRSGLRKLRRRFAPQGGILQGVCSVLLFGYNLALQVSFALLLHTDCCCNGIPTCPSFCQDLSVGSDEYAVFWIVAIVVLTVCLLPVVALLLHPALPMLLSRMLNRPMAYRFPYLVPVFDVYQSHFKPHMRFFASLYLIYRMALHSVVAFVPDQSIRTLVITCILMAILLVHLLCRPFANRRHNYIESLILLNLILVSVGMQWIPVLRNRPGSQPAITFIAVLLGFLTLFPLFCAVTAGVVKLALKCYAKRRKFRLMRSESPGEDGNSINAGGGSSSESLVKDRKYHLYSQNLGVSNLELNDDTRDHAATSPEL